VRCLLCSWHPGRRHHEQARWNSEGGRRRYGHRDPHPHSVQCGDITPGRGARAGQGLRTADRARPVIDAASRQPSNRQDQPGNEPECAPNNAPGDGRRGQMGGFHRHSRVHHSIPAPSPSVELAAHNHTGTGSLGQARFLGSPYTMQSPICAKFSAHRKMRAHDHRHRTRPVNIHVALPRLMFHTRYLTGAMRASWMSRQDH